MKLKILVLAVLSITFWLQGEEAAVLTAVANPVPAAMAVKDGYALLNSLLTLFQFEKEKGIPKSIAEIDEQLSQLSIDANATLEASLVDKIFYNRYQRMLTIIKMVITPVIRGELLKNLFQQALDDFVWDITCEHWRWGDKDGVEKVGAAMEEEFVQLKFYLDSRQAREEFKKKTNAKILPPPARKKSEGK
jgi:hypothetical protein